MLSGTLKFETVIHQSHENVRDCLGFNVQSAIVSALIGNEQLPQTCV